MSIQNGRFLKIDGWLELGSEQTGLQFRHEFEQFLQGGGWLFAGKVEECERKPFESEAANIQALLQENEQMKKELERLRSTRRPQAQKMSSKLRDALRE
ncbi:Uncharacterised protein [Chlamydia abortus]|uniref:Uncharacterized protein n=1 Tax=Paenibacillus residui TaxID=629724 RepID=A0ABW3DB05_9BACL|nr:Uncharacterised protein [Chlamydia abortus]